MATSSDSTNYNYMSWGKVDGSILTRASEPWAFNGLTPSVSADATTAATDASSTMNLVNDLRVQLVAKGILNS